MSDALRDEKQGAIDAAPDGERHAAPLDDLLADAALGPWRRFAVGSGVLLKDAIKRPEAVARHSKSLVGEAARILLGSSEVDVSPKDRRFADEAWHNNPVLHRLVQLYAATSAEAQQLVADAELDWEDHEKAQFVVDNLVAALAPNNNLLSNPDALKTARKTRGRSLLRGAQHFAKDMAASPRIPTMVDTSKFALGENMGVSPGQVVLRTEQFELIQYQPTTPEVEAVPLLLVPPMINRFYVLDLAPGRSLVEYLVGQGMQVFAVSWRNPSSEHRHWGFDAYGGSIATAIEAIRGITESDSVHLFGACSGGIVSTMTTAHLAEQGIQDHVASLTLVVTVLDAHHAGLAGAVANERTAALAKAASSRHGYLDGRTLAEVFAWLRPGDLIWNYWVNNYLMGNEPPAFDILAWNADVTRMPAGLHHDFVDQGLHNTLVEPGRQKFMGSTVDLSKITVDTYQVAGIADHLCEWQACYATPGLLGGSSRFVLSTSGHIAAIVNPPGNPRAKFRVSDTNPPDPADFMQEAEAVQGTWWGDWVEWLKARSGGPRPAPASLGSEALPPLEKSPGLYAFEE